MSSCKNLETKRTLSFSYLSDEEYALRLKKARALENIFETSDDFFGVRYWIDEEERWMRPREEEKYLNESHWNVIQLPLEFGWIRRNELCIHCGVHEMYHHTKFVRRIGDLSEVKWLCGDPEKPLVGRFHYNKYTKHRVGDVEVLTETEYMYSEKQTQ